MNGRSWGSTDVREAIVTLLLIAHELKSRFTGVGALEPVLESSTDSIRPRYAKRGGNDKGIMANAEDHGRKKANSIRKGMCYGPIKPYVHKREVASAYVVASRISTSATQNCRQVTAVENGRAHPQRRGGRSQRHG